MKIFLDSGAYSVFKRGEVVLLPSYISYLKANKQHLHKYVSLDVIGGKDGIRGPDPLAVEQSYRNHLTMKDAGLSPIPVVHRQDPLRVLERFLADGEPYIALAPHPMTEGNAVFAWLRQCFAIIPTEVKVHGLGISMAVMLEQLRFASVDSSSWVQYAKTGRIVIPVHSNDDPDYCLRPYPIAVTKRSRLRRNHIDRLDSFRRQQAERFIGDEQVRDSKPARMRVCIKFFMEQAAITSTPLFFVTNIDREQQQVLSQSGVRTRLLSYAEAQNKRATALQDYLKEGHGVSGRDPA